VFCEDEVALNVPIAGDRKLVVHGMDWDVLAAMTSGGYR